jgi:hypothetical protein
MVKLKLLGHNSFEYYVLALSSCTWTIIPISVTGSWPNPIIILFFTSNLGMVVLEWSILLWMMHRNSSFDRTDSIFQLL